MKSTLDSVVFIQLKDSSAVSGSMAGIDPDIPLPVLLASAEDASSGEGVLSALSVESVLAGILAVFAEAPNNPHREYYAKLALALRPNIREELTETAIIKMRNGDEDEAEEILLALKGMNPADREVTLNLALLNDGKARKAFKAGKGDYKRFEEAAERLYVESMNMDPPLPETFFSSGLFCLWQKDYARALEAFKTYLTLETGTGETAEARKEKAAALACEIERRDLSCSLYKAACDAMNEDDAPQVLEHIRAFLEGTPMSGTLIFCLDGL